MLPVAPFRRHEAERPDRTLIVALQFLTKADGGATPNSFRIIAVDAISRKAARTSRPVGRSPRSRPSVDRALREQSAAIGIVSRHRRSFMTALVISTAVALMRISLASCESSLTGFSMRRSIDFRSARLILVFRQEPSAARIADDAGGVAAVPPRLEHRAIPRQRTP